VIPFGLCQGPPFLDSKYVPWMFPSRSRLLNYEVCWGKKSSDPMRPSSNDSNCSGVQPADLDEVSPDRWVQPGRYRLRMGASSALFSRNDSFPFRGRLFISAGAGCQ
jgi:hypothetical protein